MVAVENKELDEAEGWSNKNELEGFSVKYSVVCPASPVNLSCEHGAHPLGSTEEERSGSFARSCDN